MHSLKCRLVGFHLSFLHAYNLKPKTKKNPMGLKPVGFLHGYDPKKPIGVFLVVPSC